MPGPNWLSAILGAVISELEAEHPGLLERVIARVDDPKLRANVIRIRGQESRADTQREVAVALRWLDMLDLSIQLTPPKKRRKWRRG